MSSFTMQEVRSALYWDTWHPEDTGPYDHRLFKRTPWIGGRTNFQGCGFFPGDQTFLVQAVGVEIIQIDKGELASSLAEQVKRELVVELQVCSHVVLEFTGAQAEENISKHLLELEGADEETKKKTLVPRGLFPLQRSIALPRRQNFEWALQNLDVIRSALGPGSLAPRIRVFMWGIHRRDIL